MTFPSGGKTHTATSYCSSTSHGDKRCGGLERKPPFQSLSAGGGGDARQPKQVFFLGRVWLLCHPLRRNARSFSSLRVPSDGLKPGLASAVGSCRHNPPRGRQRGPAAPHRPLAAARSAQLRASRRCRQQSRAARGRHSPALRGGSRMGVCSFLRFHRFPARPLVTRHWSGVKNENVPL